MIICIKHEQQPLLKLSKLNLIETKNHIDDILLVHRLLRMVEYDYIQGDCLFDSIVCMLQQTESTLFL